MPIIPRLGDRVRSTGSPGVRVGTQTPVGTFGGDTSVARAASGLTSTISKMIIEEKRKADETVLLNASTELDSLKLETYRERFKHQGEQALSYPDVEKDLVDKRIEEIGNKLSNDRQREEFSKLSNSARFDIEKQTIRHVAREREIFQQSSYVSHIANKKNVLLNNFNDENDYSDVARGLLEMAQDTHKYIGDKFGKEKAKEEVVKITSDVHSNIILKLAERSSEEAMDYYNKREDGILPNERRSVKDDVKRIANKKEKEINIRNSYQTQQVISDSIDMIADEKLSYVEKRQVIENYNSSGLYKDADYKFVKDYLDSQNDSEAITYDDTLSEIALKIDEIDGGLELSRGTKKIKKKAIKESVLPYLKKVKDVRNFMMKQKIDGRLSQYDFDRLNKNLNESVIDEEQLITNKIKRKSSFWGGYKFKETYDIFLKNYNNNIIKADDAFKQFYYAVADKPKMNKVERIELREQIMNGITAKYNNEATETVNKLSEKPIILKTFLTVEEADNSGLPAGTIVTINGRRYQI